MVVTGPEDKLYKGSEKKATLKQYEVYSVPQIGSTYIRISETVRARESVK